MSSLELTPDDYPCNIKGRVGGYANIDPAERIVLKQVRLHGADYSGHILKQFCALGSHFEECNFSGIRVQDMAFGAGRDVSEYVNCTFDRLCVKHATGGIARFVGCSFRDADIRDWLCFETEFIDCVFTGRLQRCIFNGTVAAEDRAWVGRERNEFCGNDFSDANLVDVAFRTGIDLGLQRLPSGPDYLYLPDAASAIERARRGLAGWMSGTEHQRRAMVLVDVYADTVKNGQRQLFVRPSTHSKAPAKLPREVVEKVVELLKAPD